MKSLKNLEDMGYDHPCEYFQNGLVTSFPVACEVYVAQYQREVDISNEMDRIPLDPELTPEHRAYLLKSRRDDRIEMEANIRDTREKAALALSVYNAYIHLAAKKMRSFNDPKLNELADALALGYYDDLSL